MRNNNIGAVSISLAGRKREKHSFTHDVNTTFGFTEIQPIQCQFLPPNTKSEVSTESLVRLAPINVPTFGRLQLHFWHYFVKMTDLSRNFAQLLAQTEVTRGHKGDTFIPQQMPVLPVSFVTAMALYDSFCTVWVADSWVSNKRVPFKLGTNKNGNYTTIINKLVSDGWLKNVSNRSFDGVANGWSLNMAAIMSGAMLADMAGNQNSNDVWTIPLTNPASDTFLDYYDSNNQSVSSWGGIDISPVYLESADYVITNTFNFGDSQNPNQKKIAFAFRLSDFGKRIKKALHGLGYQMDISNHEELSMMPFFAYYKAYFESFGLLAYTNWEDTAAAKLLSIYDNTNVSTFRLGFADSFNSYSNARFPNFAESVPTLIAQMHQFIKDLSFMFTTDPQEWVSAHTKSFANPAGDLDTYAYPVNGPEVATSSFGLHIGSQEEVDADGNTQGTSINNHAYINNTLHGQLDSEILKRLYKQTNVQTIAGKRVRELLEAQGLGKWADAQRTQFIGHTSIPLNIKDVASTADTYDVANSGEGRGVGDWGANGLGYGRSKSFVYENDEFGYWVTLAAVVPESGYCQAINPQLEASSKDKFYQPDADGVGYEATVKSRICGELLWADLDEYINSPLNATFGLIPNETKFKVTPNVQNGDFALRSRRDYYRSYTLDKLIDLNDHTIETSVTNPTTPSSKETSSTTTIVFDANELPVAGNLWRYTARYPWLGHLDRIFSSRGDDFANYDTFLGFLNGVDYRNYYEFMSHTNDGFLCHNIVYFKAFAPMLQIGDSFETLEDGNCGTVDKRIGKA